MNTFQIGLGTRSFETNLHILNSKFKFLRILYPDYISS